MLLEGADGSSLRLEFLGWQYPGGTDYYDNWLDVRGTVRMSEGAWEFRVPCLMVPDVHLIADWFDGLADGADVAPEIGFIEPNLEFHRVEGTPTGIRIYFELEARPAWRWAKDVFQKDLWVEFSPSPEELRRAAHELREDVAPFPQIGVRPDASD
jgi:hypothetical protein